MARTKQKLKNRSKNARAAIKRERSRRNRAQKKHKPRLRKKVRSPRSKKAKR